MNPLGYHVQVLTGPAKDTIRKQRNGSVIKWLTSGIELGEMELWRENNRNGLLIVRHVFDFNSSLSPAQRIETLAKKIRGYEHVIDVLETPYNEEMQTVDSGIAGIGGIHKYVGLTTTSVDMMRQRWPDIKVAVGHFSVGNPPDMERDWDIYSQALGVADYLSLHEYGSPFIQSEDGDVNGERRFKLADDYAAGWWCLRYRQVYRYLRSKGYPTPPLLLTEIGRDHGLTVGTNYGFRRDVGYGGDDRHKYAAELRWYAHELARDPYVRGATIFGCGMYDDWRTFDVAGVPEVENVVQEVISVPPYRDSILPQHQTTQVSVQRPIQVARSRQRTLYEEWCADPRNDNVLVGPEGLRAFLGHMAALSVPVHRVFEAGFPPFAGIEEYLAPSPAPAASSAPTHAPTGPTSGPPVPVAPQADSYASQSALRESDLYSAGISKSAGADIELIAQVLRADPFLLRAIMEIESGGNAFINNRLVLRLEPHVFVGQAHQNDTTLVQQTFQGTDSWHPVGHKVFINTQWLPVHGNQNNEWQAFQAACVIDNEAAARSCSMGWAQIMGFHYNRIGYDSALQMLDSFSIAKVNQDWGFVSFILSDPQLTVALQNKDLRTFVRIYNGPGQIDRYVALIKDKLRQYGVF